MIKVIKKDNFLIADNVQTATTFTDRLIGLMFRSHMEKNEGLIIEHCKSIHTCFMRFPIDVIFLDNKSSIVKLIRNLKPWRITGLYWRATHVVELAANTLPDNIQIGDKIEVSNV